MATYKLEELRQKPIKDLKELRGERIELLTDAVDALEADDTQEARDRCELYEADLDILDEAIKAKEEERKEAAEYARRLRERKEELRRRKETDERGDVASTDGEPSRRVGDYGQGQREIKIPATCRRVKLKAFEEERDAYVSGRWAMAQLFRHEESRQWLSRNGIENRVMAGNVNSSGGYLVPIEFESAIIKLTEEYGVFRREARNSVMISDTKNQPVWSSGLTAYFLGDNDTITASDEAFTNVSLVAKKIGTLTRYSSELSDDATISVAEELANDVARTFANKEDECGFNGDGTSTYGGIVGLKSAILDGATVTAATGNTSFAELDLADFENMVGKLPMYPGISPKWYIHKAGWAASMLNLMNAAGGNTIDTLGGGAGPSFMGYPVVFSQVMNSTLTAQTSTDGLAYFGDLNLGAVFGDRRMVSLSTSEHRYFDQDQIAVRGTERFDIKIHSTGDSSSTAGAIIMLATPAS